MRRFDDPKVVGFTIEKWWISWLPCIFEHSRELRKLAVRMARFDLDWAIETAREIRLPQSRGRAFCEIAVVASERDPRRAIEIVGEATARESLGRALIEILPRLALLAPEEAVGHLDRVPKWWHCRWASLGVLESLSELAGDDLERAATRAARLPNRIGHYIDPLARRIGWRARSDFAGALRMGLEFEEAHARNVILEQIIMSLVPMRSSLAVEAALRVSRRLRGQALRWIATHLRDASPVEQERSLGALPNAYWRRHFRRSLERDAAHGDADRSRS